MASGWLELDWGNVPTWIGAVITSTSVTVAALSYRRSVIDKERDHAGRIFAWIGRVENGGESRRQLRIANGSDAPVFDLTASVDGTSIITLPELPGKATVAPDVTLPAELPATPASESTVALKVKIMFSAVEIEGTAVPETMSGEPAPALHFRDAVRRWWQRTSDGHLKAVDKQSVHWFVSRARYRFPLLGSFEFTRYSSNDKKGQD